MDIQETKVTAKSIDLGMDPKTLFSDSPLSKDELKGLVHNIILSFKDENSHQKDLRLYAELEMLSNFIQNAKRELSSIRPDEISSSQIPTAYDELDEVIGATERATGEILEACEKIQEVSTHFDTASQTAVVNEVTKIFEACNFQDLTGQRISKVVKTLIRIDNKINAMLFAFGDESANIDKAKLAKELDLTDRERDLLLHGPQLTKDAIAQDDVDRLFD